MSGLGHQSTFQFQVLYFQRGCTHDRARAMHHMHNVGSRARYLMQSDGATDRIQE